MGAGSYVTLALTTQVVRGLDGMLPEKWITDEAHETKTLTSAYVQYVDSESHVQGQNLIIRVHSAE
ncbi:hypothetical protein KIN20_019830 [Parelaphostrongylus tenuis]|uniref:Uncharacterized protein n=1 Tax=Parelaphostrongylus tenuis TaxID=148309 RepID=A0AAD5N3H8_PARTN|nr:hypothetical protein KIN20_019830 [Parelaphostrongylus tenuis]